MDYQSAGFHRERNPHGIAMGRALADRRELQRLELAVLGVDLDGLWWGLSRADLYERRERLHGRRSRPLLRPDRFPAEQCQSGPSFGCNLRQWRRPLAAGA